VTRSVFVRENGGPEVLRLEEHDPGAPGSGEVRVRIAACGVNYIDVYMRTGLYPRPLPFVLGLEGAGLVETTGPGVRGLSDGDRVAWSSVSGSYASVVLAPVSSLVGVPKGISDETAAAVMLQGMTAHYLVHGTRETKPGDTALVHAAAGGTGLLLVQTLKRAGATVFGTCSTDEKAKLAREAGCDHVIRYTEQDVVEEVRSRTDGRRPRGLLALFGQSSGVVPPIEPYRLNILGSLFLTRPTLAHYTATRAELEMRADAVLDAVADGGLKVHIGARYGLDQVADAHRALESRATTGKLLLIP
jgi:NADPH2:quinone reductase